MRNSLDVHSRRLMMAGVWLWILMSNACRSEDVSPHQKTANQVISEAGVTGGFVVHVGCGDGQLTAAFRVNERYTVHGLNRNANQVSSAREHLIRKGLYGSVSVECWQQTILPYADNLINLLVIEDANLADPAEIQRVLSPDGVAMQKLDGTWKKTVKPRPDNIDEWTHFLHDAGNNPVARDTQVGPPRCLQWIAPPLWLRSHETPSGIEAVVSSKNRIFYFFDEGTIGVTDQRLPERWALLCRDAFNGRLLWRRPLDSWGWPEWAEEKFKDVDWTEIRGGRTVVPVENQRRLVCDGDRLYATVGYRAPLSILDAATGETIAVVKETEPAKEFIACDGLVLVHSGAGQSDRARRRGKARDNPSTLTVVEGKTGRVVWKKETQPLTALFAAADNGRVFLPTGSRLSCLKLATGEPVWQVDDMPAKGRALIAHDRTVLFYGQDELRSFDAESGRLLWQSKMPTSPGAEGEDLFVAQGVVWRGMIPVDEKLQPFGKSPDVLAIGYDLRTGEEKKRIHVRELRSPEHHHRCYRNKATERFLISGMEGAEFLDLAEDQHGQNNWLRGSCRFGVMPCNGLLYVPADQCFCQPGAKLLGFAAVAGEQPSRRVAVADDQRLEKGPAFDAPLAAGDAVSSEDWPTFRYDAARHAATTAAVNPQLKIAWTANLGTRLTQPVVVGALVYVALRNAHAIAAIDRASGIPRWRFTAGGRIDSPPTFCNGRLLFGSADGYVYCVRAADGQLVWRFLAAPRDCRLGCFDQIESVWPVHGSVLVEGGVAYFTAGRSTYLDGGIRCYALDATTGKLIRQSTLQGPIPDIEKARDVAFYLNGANSDVLVSEGGHLFMRQKKLTKELQEVPCDVLSSKGEQNVGLHVFSTAGLLDDTGYNRVFWMYSRRWPGFQLANQAPKSGQLLAVDDKNTFAINMFYRRNVHSPMYFPGREGVLLFSDRNDNEPQIVGEAGARKPVEWLPQSNIPREGSPGLDSPAFGLDKMIGYTRAEPPQWSTWLPILVRGMVKTAQVLFVAGAPDVLEAADPYAAFEGRRGARLASVSASEGRVLHEMELPSPPVFDGLIAARGQLYVALENGSLVCLSGK